MDAWLTIEEFCKLVHLDEMTVRQLVIDGNIQSKEENGVVYIEASSGTHMMMPADEDSHDVVAQEESMGGPQFVEKTIGTILSLHEKVLDSKEETLAVLRNENQFLKDALFQMQEVYEDDKKTIQTLAEQLKISQEELGFMKRKYKLMWGKVVEPPKPSIDDKEE